MLLPLAYVLIFGLFGWRLNLTLVTGAFILASSLAYGLTVPARELLFTVVDKSAKYRTKAVIDTVLFRSFDPLAAPDADVEDPYYGGPDGFVEMFDVIERAMPALLRHCRGLVSG